MFDSAQLIGQAVVAAVVTAVVMLISTLITTAASRRLHDQRIAHEIHQQEERIRNDLRQLEERIRADEVAANRRLRAERQDAARDQRLEAYKRIQDGLFDLLSGRFDRHQAEQVLREMRHTSLHAPTEVVRAMNQLAQEITADDRDASRIVERSNLLLFAFHKDINDLTGHEILDKGDQLVLSDLEMITMTKLPVDRIS